MRLSVNTLGNIVGIQAQEIAKVAEKYATMASETEVNFNKECNECNEFKYRINFMRYNRI